MDKQQSGNACIVDSFAGDMAAFDKFDPPIEDVSRFMQQRELTSQRSNYVRCRRGRPAKAVCRFRTGSDGPELYEDLWADINDAVACE